LLNEGCLMSIAIIVEGKNDRSRLRRLLLPEVDVLCTFGTPGVESLEKLKKQVQGKEIYIFTDNDPSGKKIRGLLRELFPDAYHLYTRKGYAGVEGTPEEYLLLQLEKAGLEDVLVYPPGFPAF